MRLLLLSDLHRSAEAARNLVEKSRQVDVVVGAGDFATMRKGLQEVIDVLADIDRPTVLVPGNSESWEELLDACENWSSAHVLHGSGAEIEGSTFWGVGGAIPITPFGSWSVDFSEEDARQFLAGCPPRAILVCHSPPKGAVDTSSTGESLGSEAILEAINRCEPRLVVCGHIHESCGQCVMIANTPVVNAGPGGVIWELPDP